MWRLFAAVIRVAQHATASYDYVQFRNGDAYIVDYEDYH